MIFERQETFGWLVVTDLFLAGAGAGLYLISFIDCLVNEVESFSYIGSLIGSILVIISAIFLFFDLKNKKNYYRLITNFSSWMTRGTWSIALFIIFGLAYSIMVTFYPATRINIPIVAVGIIASISAILVMSYTGFLFYEAKRVPFWNNPLLPVVFFLSSLYTGIAISLVIAAITSASFESIRDVLVMELIAISIYAFSLGLLLVLASRTAGAAAQSVHLVIRSRSFIIITILLGIITPITLFSYQFSIDNTLLPAIIASVFALTGGISLRFNILKSGVRLTISKKQLGIKYPPTAFPVKQGAVMTKTGER